MRLSKIVLALPAAALLFAMQAPAEAAPAGGLRAQSGQAQSIAQKKIKPTKTTSSKVKPKQKSGSY